MELANCRKHGTSVPGYRVAPNRVRCKQCNVDAVSKRRRDLKKILLEERGNRCERCGYDRSVWALDFHHVDPKTKEFGLSHRGLTRSLEKTRAEADKCILICANCHREHHAGLWDIEE